MAAGASAAVVSQTYETMALPTKQSNKQRNKISLVNSVDTLYNAPPATNFTPPATRTILDFDKDFAFVPGKLAQCDPSTLAGKTAAAAQAACASAKVGQGSAVIRTMTGATINAEVTAFNGTRPAGAATVLLHVDAAGVPTKPILTGVLGRSPFPGFGARLDVTVPVTPGTVIAHFDATINKIVSKVKTKKVRVGKKANGKAKFKKKKVRSYFASARCTDGSWVNQATTTFQDGSSTLDASTPQFCQKKVAKKHKKKGNK
jgi:hypothetical protein